MFPKQGRELVLNKLLDQFGISSSDYKLYLITEDIVVSEDTDADDVYDAEKEEVGNVDTYFVNAAALVGDKMRLTADPVTWTNSTGSEKSLYAWAIMFVGGDNLLCIRKYSPPRVIANGADFTFTPFIQANNLEV